jgi:hypothetical protein
MYRERQDHGGQAANAVAVSSSSIVIRGTGNDVIAYMCAGS